MDLQKFDHRSSGYDRPDDWICGHASDGRPCQLGPDEKGRCQTTRECLPALDGERYSCTRPPSLGGPCEGPLPDGSCSQVVIPCAPVAARPTRQRAVAQWFLLVAAGLVVLLFGAWKTRAWVSPGPLSHAHAEIGSCSDCHEGFEAGPVGWLAGLTVGSSDAGFRCTECHYRTDHPFDPHTMAPEDLAPITASAQTRTGPPLLALSAMLTDTASPIACTSCHSEHQGRDAELTRMSDRSCQTCHSNRFSSFSSGHPSFSDYPFDRRTRIIFDHRAHLERYFTDENAGQTAPRGCVGCHTVEASGEKMTVEPFERSCAGCHSGQIDGETRPAGTKAIAVFTAPGLDLWTLEENGYDIGGWPRLSERELTPFMALILRRDPEVRRDLTRLEGTDLLDLDGADVETLEAVVRVAIAIKRLYWELSLSGPDSIAGNLGSESLQNRGEIASLLGSLPRAAVSSAVQEWFPELEQEMERITRGEPLTVRAAAPSREESSADANIARGGDDDLLSGGDDLLAGDDDLLSAGDDLLAGDDDLLSADDDLLAGDDDLLSAGDDLLAGDDDLLSPDDDLLAGDDDLLGGTPTSAAPTEDAERFSSARRLERDPEEWAVLGGWLVDQEALLYRPVGHENLFLYSWLSVAPELGDESSLEIFDALAASDSPGACTKCHSVEGTGTAARVQWSPGNQVDATRGFTSFAHAPHFSMVGGRGCGECHRLAESSAYLSTYEHHDPSDFEPGFEEISLESCGRCHDARTGLQGCTTCHNYHVGLSRVPPRL